MSLRDALLKAGKISRQQARVAATEQRKKRKKKKGHRLEAERIAAEVQRQDERSSALAEANRARADLERAERLRKEDALRITNLIRSWSRRVDGSKGRPFYFVRSNGRIGFVRVDRQTAWELELGALGLVERAGAQEEIHIVAEEGIRRLIALGAPGVRFYVGPAAPDDPLVAPRALPRTNDPPPARTYPTITGTSHA